MPRQLIRNARVKGKLIDIAIECGHIVAIGPELSGEELIDARGGAAIPGLHDHHLHLLATAAAMRSVRLDTCSDAAAIARALRAADASTAPGDWLRATGYHERMAGPLDRHSLDAILPGRPLRIQHQTGSLWMLSSAALARLGDAGDWPPGTDFDAYGAPTGRFFRADDWLGARIGRTPPDLAALARMIAAHGITGLSDASVGNDAQTLGLLGDAVRDGRLPARLLAMGAGPIAAPEDGAFMVGPVKILLDDDRLPALEDLTAIIRQARFWGRTVAAHCVTAGELAMIIAALEECGSRPGDRIEHGSIIPQDAIAAIHALSLTVVTQPAFIATRGDRYLALVDPAEQADLYRCASLIAAGIPVAGSSDAPYGTLDPWAAIRAAATRTSASGQPVAPAECIAARRALDLYLTPLDNPAGPPRRIAIGAPADICVLHAPLEQALSAPSPVQATLTAGILHYRA